jgi:hypothetical protein
MIKLKFSNKEIKIIIVLMLINSFALFVNLFEMSIRIVDEGTTWNNKRYYLFTDVGETRMGRIVNGEGEYPSTNYSSFSNQFYPFVDFYIERTSNISSEKRFRGIFPGFDHTEFIVYSFMIIGFFLLKKTIKGNKHEEILKEGKLANNIYDNDENNFKTKSSKQIKKGKLQKLKELHEQGILTDNEYYEKASKLTSEKLQAELKITPEYKKLKSLFDDDILTKEEFESKFEILKKIYSKDNFDKQEKKLNNEFDFIVREFSEGYYVIMDNDMNYGFADSSYKKVIDTIYEHANSFKEGLALVRLNNQFGFINKDGEEIIPFMYDNAYSYENGKAKVQKGKESFYINKTGEKQ